MRQNKDVSRCNSVGIVIHKVIGGLWIVWGVWIILGMELWMVGKMRKRLRGLYPNQKRSFYNGILTDSPIPDIHITVYLIPVFLTI